MQLGISRALLLSSWPAKDERQVFIVGEEETALCRKVDRFPVPKASAAGPFATGRSQQAMQVLLVSL